jgi:spoIIIJ-associated protein
MAAPEGEAEAQAEAMEAAPEAEKPAPAREEGERRPSRGRRRRGHRGRGKAAQAEEAPAEEAAAHALEEEEETPVSAAQPAPEPEPLPPASEELVAAAKEACQAIVAAMGYEGVEVRAESLPGEARLELIGEECPALIGHRGDILDALQHIVSKMANRQAGTRTSIVVDTEGWRAQRQGNLEELAVSLARKVKETGKPAAMSPMNAHDRRIVHLLLENDTDLRTKSAGDGPMRKVVIFPRRGRRRKKAPAASEE